MGILYSSMSLAFASVNYLMNLLAEKFIFERYRAMNLFLSFLCVVSFVFILMLSCYDLRHTGVLHEKKQTLLPLVTVKSE